MLPFKEPKRQGEAGESIILIAASGPFWMWCQASYTTIKASFCKPLQDVLDDAQDDHDADDDDEVVDDDASDFSDNVQMAKILRIKVDQKMMRMTGSKSHEVRVNGWHHNT